jgi:hypothetical protein
MSDKVRNWLSPFRRQLLYPTELRAHGRNVNVGHCGAQEERSNVQFAVFNNHHPTGSTRDKIPPVRSWGFYLLGIQPGSIYCGSAL